MSVALFGLGLGWSFSYVAATTELVSLAAVSERGRLIGFADFVSAMFGAALALLGGVVFTNAGTAGIAIGGTVLAVAPAVILLVLRQPRQGQLTPAPTRRAWRASLLRLSRRFAIPPKPRGAAGRARPSLHRRRRTRGPPFSLR